MKPTKIQFMRRVRAKNSAASMKLVRVLRKIITMLENKERGEFTPIEIKSLQAARILITSRLELNALAKKVEALQEDSPRGTQLELDPHDL
jgi:hypothetical protein